MSRKIVLWCLLTFMFSTSIFPQQSKRDSLFKAIVQKRIKKVYTLDSLLYRYQNDSLALKDFLSLSQKYHFKEGEAYAFNALGKLNRISANYPQAIFFHQKALNVAKKISDPFFRIYSLNMIGVIYRRMDAVKSALEFHNKALALAKNVKIKTRPIIENIAISHNSIGNIYHLLQRDDLALEHFLAALEIEKKFDNKLGLAINYQNIGGIYEKRGNLKKALEYYKKSLSYNQQIKSTVGKVICNNSIGNIYLKKGNIDKAIQKILPNLKLASNLGDAYYLADVYVNLGKAYAKANNYNLAKKYLQKGLSIALDKKIPSVAQIAYQQFAEIESAQGHYKKALAYYKKFNEKQNEILNEKNRQLVADVIIKQIQLDNKDKIAALGQKNQLVTAKLIRTKKTFYFTLLLVLLMIVLGLIFYKQRQLNNQRQLMNLEQSLLRARMNPHFVFNALNSLKMFIIQGRPKEAVAYLSTFSKLVRTILQSTIVREVSLKEEIETLRMYVSIENIRFSNEINFDLNVSEKLDLNRIKIPPLLIQPFIENALWHGLSPKKGPKNLTVNIYPKDEFYYVIEIIDNGIGRKRAEEINKSRTFKRESIGIKLSEDRLRYFSRKFLNDYKITFEDLYNHDGQPAGTKVIIEIPY